MSLVTAEQYRNGGYARKVAPRTDNRHGYTMNAPMLDIVIRKILNVFCIVYVDFNREEYRPYRERRIGGFVRFDECKIFFDCNLSPEEDERTWAHELLSVYYYWLVGIIRHDDEVEREARALCHDEGCRTVLWYYRTQVRNETPRAGGILPPPPDVAAL